MKWMPKLNTKLISILIGVSLTTMSLSLAILLYPMLGKDDDAKNDNKKSRKIITSKSTTIQCKIPKQFVSAVIGRGGSVINDIRDKTGTYIKMNDDIESPDCTCVIRGNDMESIRLAESMIKNIIDNRPVIETYELFVSHEACWRILKKNVIQVIQKTTGAKIIFDNSSHKSESKREKRIILKGTVEQIASAVTEIEDIIREVNEAQAQIKCELAATAKRMSRSALSPRNNNVDNITSNNVLEPSGIQLPQDGLIEVYVSALESPSQFWIHVVGPGIIALHNLVSTMTEYYDKEENRELHTLKKITQGQIVAAKFEYDGKWYRAEVIAVTPEYKVWFVDYGDKDTVSAEDILELRTDMLSLRPQAVECSLANVKPRENNLEWDLETVDKFAELVSVAQKVLVAKVRGYRERSRSRREGSPIPCFDLYDKNDDKNINIGETLVRLELAQFDEEIYNRFAVSYTLPREKYCDFPAVSSTPLVERVSNATEPVSPLQPVKAINTATPEEKLEQSIGETCVETPKEKDEINNFLLNERKILTSDAILYDRA